MSQAIPVTDVVCTLGEGPIWYDETLHWVDIIGRRVHSYQPGSGALRHIELDEMVGTVVPRARGGLVVALQNGFAMIEGEQVRNVLPDVDPRRETRFNDGKCDPAGRLWAGTMGLKAEPGMGALYVLDGNLSVHEKIKNVTISNGICWSHDGTTMYYIDTPTQQVVAYTFDVETGEIKDPRVCVEIDRSEGGPDGMTIDADGNLWIALFGGRAVVCHDPRTGRRLGKIDLPCDQVTACAFGGSDLTQLYITTARVGYDEARLKEQPLAGRLFVAEPGVAGVPAIPFAG